jgi:hypothetical protein
MDTAAEASFIKLTGRGCFWSDNRMCCVQDALRSLPRTIVDCQTRSFTRNATSHHVSQAACREERR